MKTTKKYVKDYPRPQFVRDEWLNFNGEWDFRFDDDNVGEQQRWYEKLPADRKIVVPFTYESKASGIGEQSFHPNVWYQKIVRIAKPRQDSRVVLHFQAVDYIAKVWVNGSYVGRHQGGYAAFHFDITPYVRDGEDTVIVVKAEDSQSCTQPRGKQRWIDDNFGCWYTQTTGIWQTVWLEYVHEHHLQSVKITPDVDNRSVQFEYTLQGDVKQSRLRLLTKISFDGKPVKEFSIVPDRSHVKMDVELTSEIHEWKIMLWSPHHPHLYDVEFVLYQDDAVIDHVYSYFGMRKISIEKGKVLLNNSPIYQRLILDQGYWPDTILTPPSEEAILEDIDKILAMGYNGVRKHQKIEDARFLYWCDVKGVLVWSEMAAAYEYNDEAVDQFTREWLEIVRQNYNHPCIVTWVPFNESWGVPNIFTDRKQQQFTEAIYYLTKSIDPHRPVVVNDGWEHTISDIITLHDYVESGDEFSERYRNKDAITNNEIAHNLFKYAMAQGYEYKGQPIIISEFGGIAFQHESGWGYGNQVKTEEQFLERFRKITQAIKQNEYICGYCYTQITDVQQEVNGLLTENREPKIAMEKIREINLS